jgi:site-specific recombinase XerD
VSIIGGSISGQIDRMRHVDQSAASGTRIIPRQGAVGTLGPADYEMSAETVDDIVNSFSGNTHRAYDGDLKRFEDWCRDHGRSSLPCTPQTLAEYTKHLVRQEKAPRTIERALSAIRTDHQVHGLERPDRVHAHRVLVKYRKERGKAGIRDRQAAAATAPLLRRAVDACDPATPAGVRDRALILLGFALFARRSELVALNLEDIDPADRGIKVLIRYSKTDQDAIGEVVPVRYGKPEMSPVLMLRAWTDALADRGVTSGALWRPVDMRGRLAGEPKYSGSPPPDGRLNDRAVWTILRRAAQRAGCDLERLSAHSLRRGAATEMYRAGTDPLKIARRGRWKDGSPVLMRYIEDAALFEGDDPMEDVF